MERIWNRAQSTTNKQTNTNTLALSFGLWKYIGQADERQKTCHKRRERERERQRRSSPYSIDSKSVPFPRSTLLYPLQVSLNLYL